MGLLYDLHIVQTRSTKSEKVFEELFSPLTFEQVDYNSPLDYVAKFGSDTKKGTTGTILSMVKSGNVSSLLFYIERDFCHSTPRLRLLLFPTWSLMCYYIQARVPLAWR